jgi:caffeoyl-CoA O-methyltransferase
MTLLKPVTIPGIDAYTAEHSSPDPSSFGRLSQDAETMLGEPDLVSGHVVGGLLRTFVHVLRPRLVVDIGTFTGYSALSLAATLAPGGRVITCEVDPLRAEAAGKNIAASPYADRVTLRFGPALQTLEEIEDPIDLVFIDADKPNYHAYFQAALPKLADHGLIVCDNTLWRGDVLDEATADTDAQAIRAFNDAVRADPRVECVLLSVRDGVTLIRKVAG